MAAALLVVASALPTDPDQAIMTRYWNARTLSIDASNRICALDGDRTRFRSWFDRLGVIGQRLVQAWGDRTVSLARPRGLPRPPMLLCEDRAAADRSVKAFQNEVAALERLVRS